MRSNGEVTRRLESRANPNKTPLNFLGIENISRWQDKYSPRANFKSFPGLNKIFTFYLNKVK